MKLGIFTFMALLAITLPDTVVNVDTYSTIGAMICLILLVTLLGVGEWIYGMKHRDQVADDEEFNELMVSREAAAVAEEMEDRP